MSFEQRIDELMQKLQQLIDDVDKALEFYGNKEFWKEKKGGPLFKSYEEIIHEPLILNFRHERAQEALEKIKELGDE